MQTLRENRAAFERLRLRPRVLVDVSKLDMSTTILGQRVSMPICVAPTAMCRMAHADGEIGIAKAATTHGTCVCLSSWSTTSLEDVAQATPDALRWFQLYVYKDRVVTERLVRRAEAHGYRAILLTVDTPLLGKREPDVRNRFELPPHLTMANFVSEGPKSEGKQESGLALYVASLIDRTLTWEDIKWLQSITKLPIVVKGIITAEDTKIAVEHGVSGIMVSNHGARQLDGVPATIEALPEVVATVQLMNQNRPADKQVEVYMDGGVRRGTDVLKALALGARAVFVGRPVLWGLAYKGEEGVFNVLQLLKDELALAMALAGCVRVQELRERPVVVHETYYRNLVTSSPPALRSKL
eukprot:GILI01012976.1.p1 GENE.GILI01012976.1~~GILI01012976.1.p1  ORF type:complete len:414 (-),score=101.21 GILI01012976.1:129-1193(-)